MEMKEVTIKIIPSEYDKLDKLAQRKNLTIDELIFEFINTDRYTIWPKWMTWIYPLSIVFAVSILSSILRHLS